MPTSHKTRALRPMVLIVLVALAAGGCSTSTTTSGLSLVDEQGNHPANFLATHPGFAAADVERCKGCHGDALTGGIANTSCFTAACHHGTVPGWGSPGSHGAAAKRATGGPGFTSCRICHASDFTGGGSLVSCLDNAACHGAGVQSPHPAGPWRASSGSTHTNTDPANAPVCAACHFPGSANNPPNHPASPAPPGTAPGCFNDTLCHGQAAAPHALGAAWLDPAVGGANFHGLTAKQDLAFCRTCHGTPGTILFDGGVAPTACSACHPAADAHPTTWSRAPQTGFPPYTPSHRNSGSIATACAICHDVDGPGPGVGPNPAAPSCFSASFTNGSGVTASCHENGPGAPNHLVPFLDPDHLGVNQADFDVDCSNCHAVSGSSPISAAPSCQVCHTAGSPLSPTGSFGVCTSCHGHPPDGAPGTYPNVAGAHAAHLGLDSFGTGTPVDCDTCHFRLGFVTQAHYDRANGRPGTGGRVPPGDLAFDNTYDAQSGASSFDNTALSCSNVSCHGGQTTPNWQTGALTVNTQCTSCHAIGSSQYNSYNSGQHGRRQHVNAGCTACHNTTKLGDPAVGRHFLALGTTAMEVRGSVTIGGGTTSVVTYNPGGSIGTGSCTPKSGVGCHGTESW